MSLNCVRCKEVIKGDSDQYSEVHLHVEDDMLITEKGLKVTVKIEKMFHRDSQGRFHDDEPIGNICKECFLELFTKTVERVKEILPKI